MENFKGEEYKSTSQAKVESALNTKVPLGSVNDALSPLTSSEQSKDLPSYSFTSSVLGTVTFDFNELKDMSFYSSLLFMRSILALLIYLFAFIAFFKSFYGVLFQGASNDVSEAS